MNVYNKGWNNSSRIYSWQTISTNTVPFVQFFGLLTFSLILVACNNYYDPWMGIVVTGRINSLVFIEDSSEFGEKLARTLN